MASEDNTIRTGLFIVLGGLFVLAILQSYLLNNVPYLKVISPALIIIGLVFIATTAHSAVVSLVSAFIALAACFSLLSGGNILRKTFGVLCIVGGLIALTYLLAQIVSKPKSY